MPEPGDSPASMSCSQVSLEPGRALWSALAGVHRPRRRAHGTIGAAVRHDEVWLAVAVDVEDGVRRVVRRGIAGERRIRDGIEGMIREPAWESEAHRVGPEARPAVLVDEPLA